MYLIESRQLVIGNLGWVDGPNIWTFDVKESKIRLFPTGSPKYVSLRLYGDVLRLIHDGGVAPTMSLRHVVDLTTDIAKLEVDGESGSFTGNPESWLQVDPCALLPTNRGYVIIYIDAWNRNIRHLDLDWYTNGDYDLMYQGLVDCVTLPDRERLIVSVQRSSRLVVLNIHKNEKIGELELAGQYGNPTLEILRGDLLITVDYDTICLVDLSKMKVLERARLQPASGKTRLFVGDAAIAKDGLLVARPFSGDVLLVDCSDLTMLGRAFTGAQPLVAVQVPGIGVLARDWKTGTALTAAIER